MGMGYAPNAAYVMTWDDIKAIVPDAAQQFEDALGEDTVEAYCRAYNFEETAEEFGEEVGRAFDALVAAFERITETSGASLSLELGYHDINDNGDRYDSTEVCGGFFFVEGAEALTPAGERFKDHIHFAQWVEFG